MSRLFPKLRQLLHQPSLLVARKVVIAVVGGTVVLVGIAMVVLPGPAFLVIPLGLAISGRNLSGRSAGWTARKD